MMMKLLNRTWNFDFQADIAGLPAVYALTQQVGLYTAGGLRCYFSIKLHVMIFVLVVS